MNRSRIWLISCLAAIVVFAAPLLVAGAVTESASELRLVRTGDNISALIITGNERILLINSDDRTATRSAIGRLARPWEPVTKTLIAPADDAAAVGLWEALRDPRIRQAIIVGTPGSDPIWSRIERECAQRSVELEYVSTLSHVELTGAALTIEPDGMTVRVHSGGGAVAIALANLPVGLAANVAIVNDLTRLPLEVDLVVAPSFSDEDLETPIVRMNDREIVRIRFEPATLRVQGGSLQTSEPKAN
jgi:hypothetical protein